MGVYFPNMKKPPTCSECPVKLDCGLYWDVPDGGIDSNCPIIYVNSLHGKLGDLDALEAKFREVALQHTLVGDLNRMTLSTGEVIGMIRIADTVLPAEGGESNG